MAREFIAVVGDKGAGKTCYATKKGYDAVRRGTGVIANYRLTYPSQYMTFEQLRTLPPDLRGKVILGDEWVTGADSYEFWHGDAKKLTRLVAQIRKMHCQVYYTVQRFSMIPRRMRLLTDAYVLMEDLDKDKPVPFGMIHRDVCNGLFRCVFLDSERRFIRSRILRGKSYYGMYNTDEIIEDVKSIPLALPPVPDFSKLSKNEALIQAERYAESLSRMKSA